MNDDAWASLLDEVSGWAREAGAITRRWFEAGVAPETKMDGSPVTVADREAEAFLRERIEARYPEDGILGEEFGEARPGAPRRWILDPIDGTRSFVRGVPLYGVLIALEERIGVPDSGHGLRLGVAHFPMLGETVAAARGTGCWWNGRRARVSPIDRMTDALVLTTSARLDGPEAAGWNRLAGGAGGARTWGDAYGYLLVATGRAEVMVDFRLALWDVAALIPIIEEAGGVITSLEGACGASMTSGVATNAHLAAEARRLLASPAAPGALSG
jgi:histidinol phosphatase-like enzyme (inositol monophosphatase family)